MISIPIRAVVLLFLTAFTPPLLASAADSQVVNREWRSACLAQNKIGTDPVRKMAVYLPAGYDSPGSAERYPVIYYFPMASDDYRLLFDKQSAQPLFDRAIARGVIGKFILVSVGMNTPLGPSWYTNSSVTGTWEDFMVRELVPYMDANFRTIANRDSRGLVGDRIGGYGAIRVGMRHPEVFGSVYALHPVGTGSGIQIMHARPNWDILWSAKSIDDVRKDGFSTLFLTIFQAHLPDPDKPPLFTDLPAHKAGDQLVIDTKLTDRLRDSFLLETMIPQYAENLKSLRGFKFDWGRSDGNQDHVYSNQAFAHKLNEFGIPNEAEEYNGSFGERNWGEDGRVYTDVLPFFQTHLIFADTAVSILKP
ncbi:esterase [Alloacidobacterium dinghuense]|uniref:Esterase n=1 Tax=Alloacidobacterium dinghuense TaxID=2763107 RepID=A0A7G8BCZ7_9BACT|nr:alpha/beta hydrolase-fold protein [Alloacidobacterium dinghuense]QNI30417.1 esterase [Alloacidobacterium dinghuense]